MKLLEFQEKIENYCETLKIPTNYDEHLEFKKVFDYKWEKELISLKINDVLTYKSFDNNFGDIKINFKEIDDIIYGYRDKNTIRIYLFFTLEYNLLDKLKTLNEGDVINIESKVTGINSINSNRFGQIINHSIIVNFKITSFDIIKKIDTKIEFEKLENSLKKTEPISNTLSNNFIENNSTQITHTNHPNIVKSFDDLLDILFELDDLKFKSSEFKPDLNHFQNEVYNKKSLDEFNSKKGIIKNLKEREFKIICDIRLISKDNIEFKINHKGKVFWLISKKYNEELQKTTFFLKEKSSVEIDLKIKDIRDTLKSIDIELVSIQKNNKVKLFGKFIKLEVFWLGIYIFLFVFSIIILSKVNFYGITLFFFKLTLWVFIGYLINKLGVKYFYKN